eukprot:2576623-Pleurochrysis_carterae.AAC.1
MQRRLALSPPSCPRLLASSGRAFGGDAALYELKQRAPHGEVMHAEVFERPSSPRRPYWSGFWRFCGLALRQRAPHVGLMHVEAFS